MALIPILGVPSTFKVPGQYAEILFAQGPSTASSEAREVILVMPKIASPAGSWTAGNVYRINNEKDAIDGAGSGSPLHRAARKFLLANDDAKLWALPYEPSSGAGVATADGTVTYVNDPTSTGVASVTICGEICSVGYDSTFTITTLAAAMVQVINSRTWLPVTATSALGVVTLTAKVAGASQGDGTIPVIRYRAEVSSGTSTTVSTSGAALGLGAGTSGVDGATTENANLVAALGNIAQARYYYMGFSVFDATNLASIQSHVSTKSEPTPGLRSVAVVGYNHTLGTAQTLATGRNYERLQMVWQPNSDATPGDLAANMLAIRQQFEQLDSAYNFDGYRNAAKWQIPAAESQTDWPTFDDQNDAINDGITPIASDARGSYVVMTVTTRSKNTGGTVDDFRAAETHRVSVADDFTDTLLLRHTLNYSNKKLKGDELLSDGSVNVNQRLYRNVVTPHQYKPFVKQLVQEFADAAKLQEAAKSKSGLRVVRDPNNNGRLEVGLDLHVIDLLHQTTFRLAEVSTG